MKSVVRNFIIFVWAVLCGAPALAAQSDVVDTGKVLAQLGSSHDTVAPGQTINLALRTVLDDKWHTYWRNPGDSGEPVQLSWSLPDGVTVGEIVWPLPLAIPTGPIVNYGFEGAPLFPVPLTIPETAQVGTFLNIEAEAYYLVCKDICIPESTPLSLQLFVGEPKIDERWNNLIMLAKRRAPKPGSMTGRIYHQETAIAAEFDGLGDGDFSQAFFFPYDQGVIRPAAPQAVTMDGNSLRMRTDGDFWWDAQNADSVTGVLRFNRGGRAVGEVVRLSVADGFPASANASADLAPQALSLIAVLTAMIAAFMGGLILNLMPCVFPVISIKALSLAKGAHSDRGSVRRDGWIYTVGVLATFLLLTIILLVIKATGKEVGWGFQLQSPIIVGVLALLLFTIGLNLLGVFEIGSRLQNTGANLTRQSGAWGTFFTGALAVIVATPCTAPLMAGAIGYALAQPALITIVVFMALAVGFALPFLALSYMPGILQKLPKPGPWMERFKEFLAFPMFVAAAWLVWVVSLQAGDRGVGALLVAMVLIGFSLWCFKGVKPIMRGLGILSVIAAIALPLSLSTQNANAVATFDETTEAWAPERIKALNADGKNVFVDFTAAWCVTCKVNERVVLDTKAAKALFVETNTVKMIADWTNKNDAIAQELARHGRSGVPLYLVYRADNNAVSPQVLPQILSQAVLRDALTGE